MEPNTALRELTSTGSAEPSNNQRQRSFGHVVDCNGTHAVIAADVNDLDAAKENFWAVGQLISIQEGDNRVVGQAYKVDSASTNWLANNKNLIRIHIELVGEIQSKDGIPFFTSGITKYPRMGAMAHRIRVDDLEAIYKSEGDDTIKIGQVTQEASIPAKINLNKLLTRHFAIVGSTGVGKSSSVSLILRKIIKRRKDLRVIILDPHNEFTCAFADESVVKDASNLQLPFWLFRFEEFTEVIFRGQKGFDVEAELLRDLIVDAKERYSATAEKPGALARKISASSGYTADSPVPYRIVDLLKIIEERLGLLDNKNEKPTLKALRDRISSISKDPRFQFMFGQSSIGGDRMKLIVADLFRIPSYGKPICIVEMSGLPSEVVSSVASVLCRMAFDLGLASRGGIQTLVVCEEAHRYVPADQDTAFWPARQAIARIAKEGRKYGVYLAVITQRPSELDPTIFSQCNTVFAMRLSNQADQRIIGGAMTNGAQSTIGFLASIANQECIAFGEAMKTPMRLTFETISKDLLPGNNIYDVQEAVRNGQEVDLSDVIQKMRAGGTLSIDPEEANMVESVKDAGAPQREPAIFSDIMTRPAREDAFSSSPQVAPRFATEGDERPLRPNQPPAPPYDEPTPSNAELAPATQNLASFVPEPRSAPVPKRGGSASDLISAFRSKS